MTEIVYRLRPDAEAFEMVDGSHTGRRYEHGRYYAAEEIPTEHKGLFEPLERRGVPEANQ
jgi:hypothetical protein